ncbi:MAG TPA: ImmA/IrrE family metallo-endopeptidase [Bacillus bacterium]|nr:ImmA/IrrE family metallo-endopeptidase [Bacillus sp. (in: firmicutes)]
MKNHPELDRDNQIQYIANLARNNIGLEANSNRNLPFFLERAGAFIFEKEIGETIDAYSLWTTDNRPYIILGSIKKSDVRRNFDVAHELGHLLLHYKVEFTMQDKNTRLIIGHALVCVPFIRRLLFSCKKPKTIIFGFLI